MKLKTKEDSINYQCQIVEIKILNKKEGLDNLLETIIDHEQVLVGKDIQVGDIVLFFKGGTRISEIILKENNLYQESQLNEDTSKKSYMSSKGIVKCVKFKGNKSYGMVIPLSEFKCSKINLSELRQYTEACFNYADDFLVCEKYVVPVRENINGSGEKTKKVNKIKNILVDNQVRFHYETSHLSKNLHKILPTSEVVITAKLHGSSNITCKLLAKKELSWKEKIAKKLGVKVVESEYKGVWSSGKPRSQLVKGVEGSYTNKNQSFYKEDIWERAYNDYKYALEDGISLYGELLNESIQKGYDYRKLRDKDKIYTMVIYRITRTTPNGIVDEFSWNQVEEYCKKYNLQTVPVYYKGTLQEDFFTVLTEKYLEKNCEFCENKVPNEGICIRVENPHEVFKLKSHAFAMNEQKLLEEGVESND